MLSQASSFDEASRAAASISRLAILRQAQATDVSYDTAVATIATAVSMAYRI